jgi:hypothetical protein
MKMVPIVVCRSVEVVEGGSLAGLYDGQKEKSLKYGDEAKAPQAMTAWQWIDWQALSPEATDWTRTMGELDKDVAARYPGQSFFGLFWKASDLHARSLCAAAHRPAGQGRLTDMQAEMTRFHIARFPAMKAEYQAAVKANTASAFLKQVYAADHEQIDKVTAA